MKTVVVLGMHRSGTSAMAGALHHMGIHMGDRLLGPGTGNEKGHFENIQFIFLNHIILQLAGGWSFTPPTVEEIQAVEIKAKPAILRTLREEAKPTVWGWKVPSTTITIHAIHPYLLWPHEWAPPDAVGPSEVFYIVMWRKKSEIVKSLCKRNRIEPEKALRITDKYLHHLEAFLQNGGGPFAIHVHFDKLVKNAKKVLTQVCAFLNFDGDVKKGAKWVDKRLKHF